MNAIAGPLVLLALPVAAAIVTYFVRRWALLAALIAVGTAGALALLSWRLPLDRSAFVLGQEVAFGRPVVIVGRQLVLDPVGQGFLAFVLALAAAYFLFAWRIPQGPLFMPVGLAMLSLYALVVLLQSFPLQVLALAFSVALAVFAVQEGWRTSVRGAQRYLLVTLLAVPLLLATAWLLDQPLPIPGNALLARQGLLPALLGFGLLLAVFPFGTWMPALAADAPPIAAAFVFAAGQAMALYLALVFAGDAPWLQSSPVTSIAILAAGLVTAASGGVMAAVQRDLGRLFGYAALSNLGFLLLALVAGGSQAWSLALLHMVNRALAITLMAAALAIIRFRARTDDIAQLGGVARRLPIASMGLLIGGLALAGFPLTAGFPTHWSINRALWNSVQPLAFLAQAMPEGAGASARQPFLGVLVMLAMLASTIGIVIGVLRGLSAMIGLQTREDLAGQPAIASLMVALLILVVILLGLYPQAVVEPVLNAVASIVPF